MSYLYVSNEWVTLWGQVGTWELHLQRSREAGITPSWRQWAMSCSDLLTLTSFSSLPGTAFEVLRQAWMYCKENRSESLLDALFPSCNLCFQARAQSSSQNYQWPIKGGVLRKHEETPCAEALAPMSWPPVPTGPEPTLQALGGSEWEGQECWAPREHCWHCSLWNIVAHWRI